RYGMMVSAGTPASAGLPQSGLVRVVVNRKRASVPGCPDWHNPSSPDFNNLTYSNFGCAVNANLAAQVANPGDLLHGQAGPAAEDAEAAAKAIIMYRNWPHTAIEPGQKLRPLKRVEATASREDK
ncbi:MAG: CpaD family pilus assembly lipoprotein, partial [Sphingomicrobium sp.]